MLAQLEMTSPEAIKAMAFSLLGLLLLTVIAIVGRILMAFKNGESLWGAITAVICGTNKPKDKPTDNLKD